jgi:hypothetical protein
MSLRKVFPQLLDTTGASDGQVLRYIEANSRVEFVTATTGGSSDTVQDNLNRVSANVTANVGLVSDNVDSASSNVTALSTNIDTVSGNVDSYATYANSAFGTVTGFTFAKIAVGTVGNVEANVASDQLTLVAGNNITINADAATDTLTFKAALSNAVNNYFIADGTTNAFTLTQAASSNLDVLVSVEGLIQSPNLHYQVDSTTLTLMNTLPLENGTEVMVRWIPNTAENTPYVAPYAFQGSSYGYAVGGDGQPGTDGNDIDTIQKWSFTSDESATDVGELSQASNGLSSQSSKEYGFAHGVTPSPHPTLLRATRWSFSSDSPSQNVGGIFPNQNNSGAAGISNQTFGYVIGGGPNSTATHSMYKYPFSSEVGATDSATSVGRLDDTPSPTSPRTRLAGHSATTHGYISGGRHGTPAVTFDVLGKFPFSSDTDTVNIGSLTATRNYNAGVSSESNGYTMGGYKSDFNMFESIEKFPFTSDTNSSDIAELVATVTQISGTSATGYGYGAGGESPNGYDVIQKFPFSSDSPATDVGELFQSGDGLGSEGNQV